MKKLIWLTLLLVSCTASYSPLLKRYNYVRDNQEPVFGKIHHGMIYFGPDGHGYVLIHEQDGVKVMIESKLIKIEVINNKNESRTNKSLRKRRDGR